MILNCTVLSVCWTNDEDAQWWRWLLYDENLHLMTKQKTGTFRIAIKRSIRILVLIFIFIILYYSLCFFLCLSVSTFLLLCRECCVRVRHWKCQWAVWYECVYETSVNHTIHNFKSMISFPSAIKNPAREKITWSFWMKRKALISLAISGLE